MRRILAVVFVVGVSVAGTAAAVPLQCEVPVPAGATAILGRDTECGIIYMERDATLDLNGHTLTALVMGPEDLGTARFTIRGPGEINSQFPETPCVMVHKGKVTIDGGTGQVVLRHCGYGVLGGFRGTTLTLRQVTVRRTVERPMITAILANKVYATDVTIDFRDTFDIERGHGIDATSKLVGSRIVLRHTARGLSARAMTVSDVMVDDSQAAIAGPRRADITRLTSTRHNVGVYGGRVRLTDSSLSNANPGGVDIGTSKPPILAGTTCDRSSRWDPFGPGLFFSGTWGVCALD